MAESKIDTNKEYVIVVDEQTGVDGMPDVVVGLNGKIYQIARGVEVAVPGAIVNILRDAIYTKYKYDGKGKTKEYQVPRFPVRVLREAGVKDKAANKKKLDREE